MNRRADRQIRAANKAKRDAAGQSLQNQADSAREQREVSTGERRYAEAVLGDDAAEFLDVLDGFRAKCTEIAAVASTTRVAREIEMERERKAKRAAADQKAKDDAQKESK